MDGLDELLLAEVPIVVLDTETTGLSPELGHRVIEIGAVRLLGWKETERFDELVNPGRPIEAGAARVHGLTDADVAAAPPFASVAGRLSAILDSALIVAHNAAFDAGFLAMEYALASREGACPPSLPNPWLCTLQLARRQFHFGRNNLATVADRLGVRRSRAHRALNDVYTTTGVVRRMVKELERRNLYTVGDLVHAQGGPIYMQPVQAVPLPPLLGDAIAGAKQVQIVYMTSQGTQTCRVISPLYTTSGQGSSYLVAYCHLRQAQRTFRLDRILNVELID